MNHHHNRLQGGRFVPGQYMPWDNLSWDKMSPDPFLPPLPASNFHETNPTPVVKCSNAGFLRQLEASCPPSVPSNHNQASPKSSTNLQDGEKLQGNQTYNFLKTSIDAYYAAIYGWHNKLPLSRVF